MLWLPLSLIAAFASATADALLKKHFLDLSAYGMGVVRLAYTLPWLALALLFIPWPAVDRMFFTAIACGLPLEILALLCYMKALKVSPLSLTLPFLAFTPVFLIVSGRFILHETLTLQGMFGIMLIVAGAYCLHLSETRTGLLAPFKAIARETGSLLMLLVAAIYSITSAIGKVGVLHSSPAFFGIVYFCCLGIIMLLLMPVIPGLTARSIGSKPMAGLAVGAVYAVMVFSHMSAISMAPAAYMIAVKRTSLLIGVIYGGFLFKEGRFLDRLAGSAIMLCGVFVIGLS